MKKHNLAFIDVETTGFDPLKHEIIELGCVVVAQEEQTGRGPKVRVLHELEYKIKPERLADADPGALRVNGYNDADWLFAASLEQVMKDFASKVEGATFVAHNLVFDWNFVNEAFKKSGVKNTMHYGKLDTISIAFARGYHEEKVQNFKLESLADFFGIKNERAHTALADAKTTLLVYKKLLAID